MSILGYMIGQFAAWALVSLPIVALVARFLPGRAAIDGPFRGFKVGLGGAFAFYVIVLCVGFTFIVRADAAAPDFKLVEAQGTIQLEGADELVLPPHQLTIAFEPPTRVMKDEDAVIYSYVVRIPARHIRAEVYEPMLMDAIVVTARDHYSKTFFVDQMVVPTAGSQATLNPVQLRPRTATGLTSARSDVEDQQEAITP